MKYDDIVQKTIFWIENNLQEKISAKDISKVSGFSRYHFHRIFLSFTGMTFTNYIRMRRITKSANLLNNTNLKIIDIAFYYHFESQESFTRTFRKYYGLPPGRYRKLMKDIRKNKEVSSVGNEIKGWFLSGSNPYDYEMDVDHNHVYQGNVSAILQSKNSKKSNSFGTMMQQFNAKLYKNSRVKLSAFIKTESITESSGLWMRVDDKYEDILQFDNMSDRPIKGTNNWNIYSVVLDVPEESEVISFGILLNGPGKVWIDNIKFTKVNKNVPSTNMNQRKDLLDEPVNLSFED
ncbi:helix-turn-helix transcriptional regulator [Mammaliicoccus vitulinus]|uniref:helix-turn-helix domain-containing protein n=1 Tax=Mammaliicoccus vitulinus TaxID=71237 RepID=UPI00194FB643|nr:AraC family transcriptional regulator [Mammaliicoccus vitulinus]MBM6630262.1 helix-turn-helix transcriptional regulator [Mammaliicoccus vitulinus]WQK87708.1 AraC family transcriptional regulator [Mammaliicoccus vitulinus]